MADFANFSNTMPDPSIRWGLYGEDSASTGVYGPGFKSIKLSSKESLMKVKFNSFRDEKQGATYQNWEINIGYNTLISTEFKPLFAFLTLKRATLTLFYVYLPQFVSQTTTNKTTSGLKVKGESTLAVTATGVVVGEAFSIVGETKVYIVTRVETETEYRTWEDQPGHSSVGYEERIHFTPPLQKDVATSSAVNFEDIKFLVRETGDMTKYSIGKDGLYSMSLNLEEVDAS